MMKQILQNRNSAGCQLADLPSCYSRDKDTIVLALPRGGVPRHKLCGI
jgi:predicted phosphoribosyltransferase